MTLNSKDKLTKHQQYHKAKRKDGELIIKQQMENFLLRPHSWLILNWEMYDRREEIVLSSVLLEP